MFRRQTISFEAREYISALQNRNKTDLLLFLGSAPPLAEEIIPEDDELKRGRMILLKTARDIARHAGISDILPLGQLSRMGGAVERAQSRLFRDMRQELAGIFVPLEVYAKSVMYHYEQLVSENYVGSSIGGWAGAAIGFYYLGPSGAAAGSNFGAFVGGLIEQRLTMGQKDYIDYVKDFWELADVPIFDITGTDVTDYEPPDDGTGGVPPTRYYQTPLRTYEPGRLLQLQNWLYGGGHGVVE